MTIESRELASAKEFLKLHSLTEEFARFHQEREQILDDLAKPEFDIRRGERIGERRSKEKYANITPWLRTASVEEIQRLITIDPESLPDEGIDDTDDVKFLDKIWNSKPDDDFDDVGLDDDDWTWSYYGYFDIDMQEFIAVVKEVNPAAYRQLFMQPEEMGQASFL